MCINYTDLHTDITHTYVKCIMYNVIYTVYFVISDENVRLTVPKRKHSLWFFPGFFDYVGTCYSL